MLGEDSIAELCRHGGMLKGICKNCTKDLREADKQRF